MTATAGYDAIAHAVETAVTTRRTPLSDAYSQQAWRMLSGAFERALTHPGDLEARSTMQVGAFLAGLAIEHSMLGAAHACANPLTARTTSPTGRRSRSCCRTWSAGTPQMRPRRYRLLVPGADDGAPAEALAARLERYGKAAGLPATLSETGIPSNALAPLAALAAQQWTGGFNPRPFDAEGALEIYEAAL